MRVIGVDGCSEGWVGVELEDGKVCRAFFERSVKAVLGAAGKAKVIAIDIPIGGEADRFRRVEGPMRSLCPVLACIALAAGCAGDSDCGDPVKRAAYERCSQARNDADCLDAGGTPGQGPFGEWICRCATGQEGCPCTSAQDCLGHCVADLLTNDCPKVTHGECTSEEPIFACACVAEGSGFEVVCWD